MFRPIAVSVICLLLAGCSGGGGFADNSGDRPPMRDNARHFLIEGKVVDVQKHRLNEVTIYLEKTRAYQISRPGETAYRYAGIEREKLTSDGEFSLRRDDLASLKVTIAKDGYEAQSFYFTFAEATEEKQWLIEHSGMTVVLEKSKP